MDYVLWVTGVIAVADNATKSQFQVTERCRPYFRWQSSFYTEISQRRTQS